MRKQICNMDCLNCVFPDCINNDDHNSYYDWKERHPDTYARHLVKNRERNRARYHALKAQGICVSCGRLKAVRGTRCVACADKQARYHMERRYAAV